MENGWQREDWIAALLLGLLPFAVYVSVFCYEYGLTDDYSLIKTMAVNPSWNWEFAAGSARPIYAWLRALSFGSVDGVATLVWLRLLSVAGLGVLAAGFYAVLRRQRLPLAAAATMAVLSLSIPGAQVYAGWAVTWPFAWITALSVLAFGVLNSGWPKAVSVPVAMVLLIIAGLTYQSNAFFFLVPLLAVTLFQEETMRQSLKRWLVHLCVLGGAMVLAYLAARLILVVTNTDSYGRTAFTTDPVGKLQAWLHGFWPKALNVWSMQNYNGAGKLHYYGLALLSAILIAAGALRSPRRWQWLASIGVAILSVNALVLLIAENYASYRLVYVFSMVLMVALVAGVYQLSSNVKWQYVACALLALSTLATAALRTHKLIAKPQAEELQRMQTLLEVPYADGARSIEIIRMGMADSLAPYVTTNEFGLPSSHTDYAAEAMPWLIWHKWDGSNLQKVNAGNDLAWQVQSRFAEDAELQSGEVTVDMRGR